MKKQALEKFLENSIPKTNKRPVLEFINKNEHSTHTADGYRLHIDFNLNGYVNGLNHTSYTIKENIDYPTANYPSIDAILPISYDAKFEIDSKIFEALIKFSNIMTKKIEYSTLFKVANNILIVTSAYRNHDNEIVRNVIETPIFNVDVKHKTESFALNGKYVLDAIAGLKHSDTITVKIRQGGPTIFEVENDRMCLIMPMSK